MDESLIYEIQSYLPIKLEDPSISEYIGYHLQELEKSIKNSIDSGIFFHTHILYMIFIYIQLLRISQNKKEEFKYSWIGLANNEKDFLKENNSPFAFSKINEKTVFRFFRLIDFDDSTIGEISACIKERNELLHATGLKILNLDEKINKYLRNMRKIFNKSVDFLDGLFGQFLEDNVFGRGYEITHDDLELNLYIPYFFSEIEMGYITKKINNKVTKAIKLDLGFDKEYYKLFWNK